MNPASRLTKPITDRFRSRRLNRVPSPILAEGLPWLSILLGSFIPLILVIGAAPVMPPIGFMMLLSWRQLRPGLLPVWSGVPLGAFDDLFSGQPFGSAILLWSLAIILLDVIEARFPWRNFLLDWFTSALIICLYLALGLMFANAAGGGAAMPVLVPQLISAFLVFPLVSLLVSGLDKLRLIPIVDLD
jgi:rod shape-determining protein MreD